MVRIHPPQPICTSSEFHDGRGAQGGDRHLIERPLRVPAPATVLSIGTGSLRHVELLGKPQQCQTCALQRPVRLFRRVVFFLRPENMPSETSKKQTNRSRSSDRSPRRPDPTSRGEAQWATVRRAVVTRSSCVAREQTADACRLRRFGIAVLRKPFDSVSSRHPAVDERMTVDAPRLLARLHPRRFVRAT